MQEENLVIYSAHTARNNSDTKKHEEILLQLRVAEEVQVFAKYQNLSEVFSKAKGSKLAADKAQDYRIETKSKFFL